jgi:hypothetical protein
MRGSVLAPETARETILAGVRAAAHARQRADEATRQQRTAERIEEQTSEAYWAGVLAAVRADFAAFLPYWQFKDRESGAIRTFETLWPGQARFRDAAAEHDWLLALKAGKLGFTELECAYDAWVALYRCANARVHLFSRDLTAAKSLLEIVRFGIYRMPSPLRLPIMSGRPGGDTTTSLRLGNGADDTRIIEVYAAGPDVSIDQTCNHAHVDELARMAFADKTWAAVYSTVSPFNGTCHIVSRGAGDDNILRDLWEQSERGDSRLFPLFVSWEGRPDRDRAWYESLDLTGAELRYFAPEAPEDALSGDEENEFVAIEQWDACLDLALPALLPRTREPVVLGVDAGVTNDCFAITGVTRHPARHDEAALRLARKWDAPKGGSIDFSEVERYLRLVCAGGCVDGHPNMRGWQQDGCGACASADAGDKVAPYNVVQICYDPYQLHDMMERLLRDHVAWCDEFPQGTERLEADSGLRQMIVHRRLAHRGDEDMREHIGNARAKVAPYEDTKLRIVKRAPHRKVDLAVALSMAAKRCLDLNL